MKRATTRTYIAYGKVCRRGHVNPERYVRDGGCVQCAKDNKAGTLRPKVLTPVEIARRNGDRLYDCGVMCSRGHGTLRLTKRGCCPRCEVVKVQEAIEIHPEYRAVSQANRSRRYRENEEYRAAVLAGRNNRYKEDETYRGRLKAIAHRWRKKNRAYAAVLGAKYRAQAVAATPAWLTDVQLFQMRLFYLKAARLTEVTSIPHEVDHIIPLQGKTVCGLNVPWNLQVLTAEENRRKRDGMPGAGELICRTAPAYRQPVSVSKRRTKPTTT